MWLAYSRANVGASLLEGVLTDDLAIVGGVHIHCCGNGCLWFRPYGESLFQTPKRNQKARPKRSAPRWGSGFLRSGIHPGASPSGWLRWHLHAMSSTASNGSARQSPDECLHSACRTGRVDQKPDQQQDQKQDQERGELTLGLLGWFGLVYVVWFRASPSPQPSPHGGEGEREPIFVLFKTGVRLDFSGRRTSTKHLGQSPLPLGERVRVRGRFLPGVKLCQPIADQR